MRVVHTCMAEHPHLAQVEAVLTRMPYLTDAELTGLADAWHNTAGVAKARSKALSPGSTLIVDVLQRFHDLSQLYADDLAGEADFLTLETKVVTVALKAVRDAIAGTILGPGLSRREAARLTAPWDAVMRTPPMLTPPPRRDVDQLMAAVAGLGDRCHDQVRAAAFERILLGAITRDRDAHASALRVAQELAVSSRRRRTLSLMTEQVETSVLSSSCRRCPTPAGLDGYDRERVAMLCSGAVSGLLVADLLTGPYLDVLLEPLSGLVPFPRPPLGA